jgi:hypothetical protein
MSYGTLLSFEHDKIHSGLHSPLRRMQPKIFFSQIHQRDLHEIQTRLPRGKVFCCTLRTLSLITQGACGHTALALKFGRREKVSFTSPPPPPLLTGLPPPHPSESVCVDLTAGGVDSLPPYFNI